MLACAQYQPGYSNGGIPASMANPRPKINPEQVRGDAWPWWSTCRLRLGGLLRWWFMAVVTSLLASSDEHANAGQPGS